MNVSITHPTDKANFTVVRMGPIGIYFSYSTPIAFYTDETGLVVRQNDWSNTTGRHLTEIDGGNVEAKKRRISGVQFTEQLDAILARFEVTL